MKHLLVFSKLKKGTKKNTHELSVVSYAPRCRKAVDSDRYGRVTSDAFRS